MATTIDTLKIAKSWRAAKTEEERAEVLAASLRELRQLQLDQLATKADLIVLEQRLVIKVGGMLAAAVVIVGALVAPF